MSLLQAPPGLLPPTLAARDLPSSPLDEPLHLFVNEIRSPQYQYHLGRGVEIIDEFLFLIRNISLPIVNCIDLDDYFRAVFRFLSEKNKDERVSPRTLRNFWEVYSLSSRQMAFDNACEDLRLAEDEHCRAHENHKIITRILASQGCVFIVEDKEYKAIVDVFGRTLQAIQDCFEDYELAAKNLSIVQFYGVYLHPQDGDSPLKST